MVVDSLRKAMLEDCLTTISFISSCAILTVLADDLPPYTSTVLMVSSFSRSLRMKYKGLNHLRENLIVGVLLIGKVFPDFPDLDFLLFG